MTILYPSWIEIPVTNLNRALTFYRAVFALTDTALYDDEPSTRIAVLLPSEKSVRGPGVSLVQSPQHMPCHGGVQINFHVGDHSTLTTALETALAQGGAVITSTVAMSDGVRYATIRDSEGNFIALSSYEPLDTTD